MGQSVSGRFPPCRQISRRGRRTSSPRGGPATDSQSPEVYRKCSSMRFQSVQVRPCSSVWVRSQALRPAMMGYTAVVIRGGLEFPEPRGPCPYAVPVRRGRRAGSQAKCFKAFQVGCLHVASFPAVGGSPAPLGEVRCLIRQSPEVYRRCGSMRFRSVRVRPCSSVRGRS